MSDTSFGITGILSYCTIHCVCIWLILIHMFLVLKSQLLTHACPHRAAPVAGKSSHGLTFQSLPWRLQLHHVPPSSSGLKKNSQRGKDLSYIEHPWTSYIDQWCFTFETSIWRQRLFVTHDHHKLSPYLAPRTKYSQPGVACRARWAMAASLWRSETASWKTTSVWWLMRLQF